MKNQKNRSDNTSTRRIVRIAATQMFSVLLTLAVFVSSGAQAHEGMDGERLRGINTISVGIRGTPGSELLRGQVELAPFVAALKDVFSKEK